MADEARAARLKAIRDAADAEVRRRRIREAADAVPEGDKRAAELRFQRERGLAPESGIFGKVLEVASRPMEAVHAGVGALARGEGLGGAAREVGAAALGRREGTAAENLLAAIPPKEGETPFGPRALLRLGGAIATDPLSLAGVGTLTKAGKAAKLAAPEKFLGPGKLSRVARVEQGLQKTATVGVPFTDLKVGLPTKIDAMVARGTKAALDLFGKGVAKTMRATPLGRSTADALLDAFSKTGSSPEVAELRQMAESIGEDALRRIFTHSRELPAISKGADLVAEQMSKTAGRTIAREEVLTHAFDFAENAVRDPARFAETPPIVREFADLELRPFVDSIRREIEAEVRISPLAPPREAIADARLARVREAEDVLAQMDEVGVERLSIDDLRGEAMKASDEGPTLFRAKTVEPKLKVAREVTPEPSVARPTIISAPGLRPSGAESPPMAPKKTYGIEVRKKGDPEAVRPRDADVPEIVGWKEQYFTLNKKGFAPDRPAVADVPGQMVIAESPDGKTLHIRSIDAVEGPRSLGPSAMREVMEQVAEIYPRAERVQGRRVSGIRTGGKNLINESHINQPHEITSVPIRRPKKVPQAPPFVVVKNKTQVFPPSREELARAQRVSFRRLLSARQMNAKTVERIARENRAAVEAARIENARRVELASKLNASIVKQVDLDILEPRYLPHVSTKYGREFFGLTRDEMAQAVVLPPGSPVPLRTKGIDRFSKMRSFRKADGTSLGAVEVNELAKRGELPGYEGVIAKDDIFSVEPIQFGLARLFEAEKAIAEMRLARKAADRFGVPRVAEGGRLRTADELGGFEVVDENHKILRNYAFPPAIAREMKHTLKLMSPGSGIQALMLRAFNEINRLWVEWTLLPFFSTISRNAIGEWYFTFLGGGEVSDAAYALGIMTDVWQPFRNALERGVSSDRALQKLREVGLARLEISGEGKLALLSEPSAVDDASKAFQGVTDGPGGQRVPFAWSPTAIAEEAFARGIVGGGWSPSDLQETVRTALGQVRNETFLKKVFQTSEVSPVSRRFVGLKPHRKMQAFADDWPRMSHFVSMLRKGLTPNEAAFEVKKSHVSGNLTPFEQRYLRPLIPFYRWMRFNIPKTFETIVRHPQVPYQLHKAYEYLTLGGERVDERDLPPWMRDNAAVPIVTKTLEDGRRIAFVTTPTGLWPVADALEWSTPENAADYALAVWNPFLAHFADITPSKYQGSPKDDSFLGVRMDAEKAATIRRLWRLGNVLDQMALPKGLSQDERAYRRWVALGRLANPVPISMVEEGAGRKIEGIKTKMQMREADSRARRSLSRFGRLAGDPQKAADVMRERDETKRALREKLEELRR